MTAAVAPKQPSAATACGNDHFAITPHASNDIIDSGGAERVARAIYVGTGGDIAIVSPFGNVVVYKNAVSGSVIQMQARRVNAVGTTATDLVAMF